MKKNKTKTKLDIYMEGAIPCNFFSCKISVLEMQNCSRRFFRELWADVKANNHLLAWFLLIT